MGETGAVITQSSNIVPSDENKGRKSYASPLLTQGIAQTDEIAIDYSSMGTSPSTFSITTTNPEGMRTTNDYSGSRNVGFPVRLPVMAGTNVNVEVVLGDPTSRFNFNIKVVDNTKTETQQIPKSD